MNSVRFNMAPPQNSVRRVQAYGQKPLVAFSAKKQTSDKSPKKRTVLQKMGDWFKSVWKSFVNFLSKIFSVFKISSKKSENTNNFLDFKSGLYYATRSDAVGGYQLVHQDIKGEKKEVSVEAKQNFYNEVVNQFAKEGDEGSVYKPVLMVFKTTEGKLAVSLMGMRAPKRDIDKDKSGRLDSRERVENLILISDSEKDMSTQQKQLIQGYLRRRQDSLANEEDWPLLDALEIDSDKEVFKVDNTKLDKMIKEWAGDDLTLPESIEMSVDRILLGDSAENRKVMRDRLLTKTDFSDVKPGEILAYVTSAEGKQKLARKNKVRWAVLG